MMHLYTKAIFLMSFIAGIKGCTYLEPGQVKVRSEGANDEDISDVVSRPEDGKSMMYVLVQNSDGTDSAHIEFCTPLCIHNVTCQVKFDSGQITIDGEDFETKVDAKRRWVEITHNFKGELKSKLEIQPGFEGGSGEIGFRRLRIQYCQNYPEI